MDSLQGIENEFKELNNKCVPSLGVSVGLFDKDNICMWRVTY